MKKEGKTGEMIVAPDEEKVFVFETSIQLGDCIYGIQKIFCLRKSADNTAANI